jgi:hypothetical protein
MNTDLFTFSGQALVLLGAVLGAGGGLRYLVEPLLKRRRLRRVIATGLWLSCYELRSHLEAIVETLAKSDTIATQARDALMKIPRWDAKGRADWYVKAGYFAMITAYKIAVFSSWMRIYQITVLQALVIGRSSEYTSGLFRRFDAYKVAASRDTILWYSYIDAIGEKLISTEGELNQPLNFSEFCKRYHNDREFLFFFDQLHMFIHFVGREKHERSADHKTAVVNMNRTLREIENLLQRSHENLLAKFKPGVRNRVTAAAISEGDERPPAN